MAVKFGRIHALDFGDTGLILAAQLNASRILEDVCTFWQVIDEEMTGCVARTFVVAQAILIFVLGKDIHGLCAAAALVF